MQKDEKELDKVEFCMHEVNFYFRKEELLIVYNKYVERQRSVR